MKRALVLTTESARHPFRQTLPPHVYKVGGRGRRPSLILMFLRTWAASFVASIVFLY